METNAKQRSIAFSKQKLITTVSIILVILISITCISYFGNKKNKTLLSVKRVGNMELYTMEYFSDYKFDDYLKKGSGTLDELKLFLNKNIADNRLMGAGDTNPQACSVFSAVNEKGEGIFGRNLDLPGMHPALLLFTHPKEGYSSVTMVELLTLGYNNETQLTTQKNIVASIKKRKALLQAPYVPRDGMNEKGLAVATLDVPYQLPEFDINKINIGRWQALRLMLDYAANVDEAIELMGKYNAFDGRVHFFISDRDGNSAVLECYEGKMYVTKNSESYMAATNFIICDPEKQGGGHDRYNLIQETLENCSGKLTEKDAMGLLKSVAQSTAWSVTYNQQSGSIQVALGQDYNNIKTFRFDIKK